MAKQSVLSRPKVDHNISRNGFDRSSRKAINFSAGMLIPVDWRPVTAGSKVKLNRKCFIRTADVNTAAFTPIDFHVEYYKVPLRLLWSRWNDFKLNIQDSNSTALFNPWGQENPVISNPVQLPNFDFNFFENIVNSKVVGNVADSDKDSNGFLYANGFYRLKDLLRYGNGRMISGYADDQGIPSWLVTPFAACAYQKIYMDFFRNTSYESNDPYAYNLDWCDGTMALNSDGDSLDYKCLRKMFMLRYVNYRNDYFMNIYPSLNYVSSEPRGSWVIPSSIHGAFNGIASQFQFGVVSNIGIVGTNGDNVGLAVANTSPNGAYGMSVQSIRAAFALDKLMRASAYAPKHVQDQFKARFGVEVSDKVSGECERLGSFMTDIKLMEITSSADTDRAGLGAIGAKGIGVGDTGKTIETYCEEDCIIMGVAYALPRTSYDALGCDEWLTKLNREQLFQPEFENLGLEPVYMWQLKRWFNPSLSPEANNTINNQLIGYRPRNQVYKLSADLNHGEFRRSNPQWQGQVTGSSASSILLSQSNGARTLDPFVVHSKSDFLNTIWSSTQSINYQWFKVSPMDLNDLFVGQYNYSGDQIHDQFFMYFENVMPTIQNMSVHGQPRM